MQPADTDTKVEEGGKGTKRKSEQDEGERKMLSKRTKAQKQRTWWIGCTLKKGASETTPTRVVNKGPWGNTGGDNQVTKRRKQDKDEAVFFIPWEDAVWIRVKEPEVKGLVINVEVFENRGKPDHCSKHGDFLVRDLQFSKHANLEAAKEAAKHYFFPAHWTRHVFHVCV